MTNTTCSIDSCGGQATRRGFCTKHYQRWRRHGDPLVYRPDATRGCSVEGCLRGHYGLGFCSIHWTRQHKTGDPLGLRPHFSPLTGQFGESNPSWRGDDVGYGGVHQRLRDDPAARYRCRHCGCSAEHWAYDHADPDERLSRDGLAYSVKGFEHYIPLCVPCHRRFDQG